MPQTTIPTQTLAAYLIALLSAVGSWGYVQAQSTGRLEERVKALAGRVERLSEGQVKIVEKMLESCQGRKAFGREG